MSRSSIREGVSVVALQLFCVSVSDPARAQSAPLPAVTVQAPNATRPVTVHAGKKSGARRASAKRAPAEVSTAVPKPANALGTYNPALDLPGLTLPPGTTITTAGPVDGYRALSAFSATKTATPIEQIPQSIQVIPQSVLADQSTTTVTEALQNVSNVQGTNALAIDTTGLTGSTLIRGFQAQYWVDGLNVNYALGDLQSLSNVERIEVLKGPNAILYGGGTGSPVGGAYNVVSKLPTDRASVEIGVLAGSYGYVQPYFDVNEPLNADKTALFRFTGSYTSSGSFIEDLNPQRYSTVEDSVPTLSALPRRPAMPAAVNTLMMSRQPIPRRSAASNQAKCPATNWDSFFRPPPGRW